MSDLQERINVAFQRLEKLYPEHKVFALSSLDDELRETLNRLYVLSGAASLNAFLEAHGYTMISGSEVRDIRGEVIYSPGYEPEPIRTKVQNMCALLEQYYPNHVIHGSLQNDHKSLSGKVSGLYQWLGYPDAAAMLEAYGYTYQANAAGRPENDYQGVIDFLLEKYSGDYKPKNMGILIYENPDLRGKIKTLQNKANELFGMSFKTFLEEIGILPERAELAATKKEQQTISKSEAALAALQKKYDSGEAAGYGSFETAYQQLEGLVLKQNKAGALYIFGAKRQFETITIPFGVDSIAADCFKDQKSLRIVILPDSVSEIGSGAFSGCTMLSELHLGNRLKVIGEQAFSDCRNLASVTLPNSLEKLGKAAFSGCERLETVAIENLGLSIPEDAFSGCVFQYVPFTDTDCTDPSLFTFVPGKKGTLCVSGYTGTESDIRIPSFFEGAAVSAISVGAFQYNSYLQTVYIPDTVTTIQKDAFKGCANLKKVRLSNALDKLVTTVFSECAALEEINIPDALVELRKATFKDSLIRVLKIGKSLKTLYTDTFIHGSYHPVTGEWVCYRTVQTVTVDEGNPWMKAENGCLISKDGTKLIAALRDVKNYVVPEGVEEIAECAFKSMKELTDISFSESLINIGNNAFESSGLRSLRFGRQIRTIGMGALRYSLSLSSVIFEEGIEAIKAGAFEGCPIVSVFLPATIRELGLKSFSCFGSYNNEMRDLRISEENPYLHADGAALYQLEEGGGKQLVVLYGKKFKQTYYDDMSSRQKVYSYCVESGTTSIADSACEGCTNLKNITLPEGLQKIGRNAFRQTRLQQLLLPASLRSIDSGALRAERDWNGERIGLEKVSVAEGNPCFSVENDVLLWRRDDGTLAVVTCFGDKSDFTLPTGTDEILEGAFANSNVQSVSLPATIRTVGEHSFDGCTALKRIRIEYTEDGKPRRSSIYFPAVERSVEYWGPSLRDQFLDCIRADPFGNLFDYEKYDSLFESISKEEDKILVAVDRLKSKYSLKPVYESKYQNYLSGRKKLAAETVILSDDAEGLKVLSDLGCFDKSTIDGYIDLANKKEKMNSQVFLMEYKNHMLGYSSLDEFKLDFGDADADSGLKFNQEADIEDLIRALNGDIEILI